MYCKKCGMEIDEGVKFCPFCGEDQEEEFEKNIKPYVQYTESKWWGVLGFFVPLIGLILYLVWKNEQPMNARYAGKGALISVIVEAVLVVLYICCIVIAVTTGVLDGLESYY